MILRRSNQRSRLAACLAAAVAGPLVAGPPASGQPGATRPPNPVLTAPDHPRPAAGVVRTQGRAEDRVLPPGEQPVLPPREGEDIPRSVLPPVFERPGSSCAAPGMDAGRVPISAPGAAGGVPQPSPRVREEYGRFVERTVEPEDVLELTLGLPKLLVFKEAPRRIQLAEEEGGAVAAFVVVTEKELSLVGRRLGKTVLNLWFADPDVPDGQRILSYLVRVVPDREGQEAALAQELQSLQLTEQARHRFYADLERQINCAFPRSRVYLKLVKNNLLVSGEAHDAAEATAILRLIAPGIARSYEEDIRRAQLEPPADATTIVTERGLAGDRTTILPPSPPAPAPAPERPEIVPAPPAAEAPPADAAVRPARLIPELRDQAEGSDTYQVNVINLLRVPGEQQVMLRVVVAEVNRAAARSIGLNFGIANDDGQVVFANTTGGLLNVGGNTGGGTGGVFGTIGGNLPALLDNGQVALAIQALKTHNLAKSLAEPNLVAINGQAARFQAGGEFPVPVVTGFTAAGLQGVSFVPFGVQLTFLPTVLDKDRIRLNVAANVSTRDLSASANVGGTTVPGLTTRNFQTVVELREGQTLAVAGLIQNNYGTDTQRMPFLGDLPLVGQLTGRTNSSAGEQELVVLVSPELIHPVDPGGERPLPGADLFEPSDVEFYIGGRLEGRRPYDYRSPARTDIHRQLRYQRCDEVYIIGPHGYSDPHDGPAP